MTQQPNDDAETGRLAGVGAGTLAGAQLGTVLIPIPFVGTVTGAVLGGALGGKIGQRIAPTLINTFNQVLSTLQPSQAAQSEQPTASAGGSIPITKEAPEATNEALLANLEQLGRLHTQGVLTSEEFSAAKSRLLNS